jgi:outer membrane protein OmpA-like peptidoglycan-associated protein
MGRGTEAFNQPLSERRAAAVADVLRREGVDGRRISIRGLGEARPVADNTTPTGRAMNRRVEMLLRPPDEFVAENRGAGRETTQAVPAGEPY